jgi:hypothetical protein
MLAHLGARLAHFGAMFMTSSDLQSLENGKFVNIKKQTKQKNKQKNKQKTHQKTIKSNTQNKKQTINNKQCTV